MVLYHFSWSYYILSLKKYKKEQKYAAKYRAEGKKIILIGSSFDEGTWTIHEWTVANS